MKKEAGGKPLSLEYFPESLVKLTQAVTESDFSHMHRKLIRYDPN